MGWLLQIDSSACTADRREWNNQMQLRTQLSIVVWKRRRCQDRGRPQALNVIARTSQGK